jgi:hypothetical protein
MKLATVLLLVSASACLSARSAVFLKSWQPQALIGTVRMPLRHAAEYPTASEVGEAQQLMTTRCAPNGPPRLLQDGVVELGEIEVPVNLNANAQLAANLANAGSATIGRAGAVAAPPSVWVMRRIRQTAYEWAFRCEGKGDEDRKRGTP